MGAHSPLSWLAALAALVIAGAGPALAQSPTPGGMPPPPGMSLAQSAAMRFPQPVRVGTLVGRAVLQPVEAQTMLGRIRGVVRAADGTLLAVVDFGGVLGVGSRPIAIPIDALALVGDVLVVVAFTPAQLQAFPAFAGDGVAVGADEVIKVGLAKPSH